MSFPATADMEHLYAVKMFDLQLKKLLFLEKPAQILAMTLQFSGKDKLFRNYSPQRVLKRSFTTKIMLIFKVKALAVHDCGVS